MFNFNVNEVNFEEVIGQGFHSIVYAYQHKNLEDEEYVVKRVITPTIDGMLSGVQEIVLGFSCNHQNVLPIKGYHIGYDRDKKSWDIFMKMPRMKATLKEKIDQYTRDGKMFPQEEIIRHFYALSLGLKYIHSKSIVHRDIKPDNILIDKNGQLKIADIGIGKFIEDGSTDFLTRVFGVPCYIAPEVLKQGNTLKKQALFLADLWSLGVVMAEICVSKTRIVSMNENGKENETRLAQMLKELEGTYDKGLLELVLGLLRANPEERKSLEEVQRVLEDKYSDLLGSAVTIERKLARICEENEILKVQLRDMQKMGHQILSEKPKEEECKSEERNLEKILLKDNSSSTLRGHSNWVSCLEFLSTGELASGSWDNTIKIWCTKTSACLLTIEGHSSGVTCLLSLSTDKLASSSADTTIKVWDTRAGRMGNCLQVLRGHTDMVWCLQLLSTGALASGSDDKTIKIWDIKTGTCCKTLQAHSTYCLQSLPTGGLVSGSTDKSIKIWDLKTNTCIKTLQGHSNFVECLCLLPTGELASGSQDKSIKIWDLKKGICLKTLEGHTSMVRCLKILPSGELASGSGDKTIKLWNLMTGTCVKTLQGHTSGVGCLQLLPLEKLVSGSWDQTIKFWN